MAFIFDDIARTSGSMSDLPFGRTWVYRSDTDTIADMSASGYFNDMVPQFNAGDYIYLYAESVGQTDLVQVTDIAPNVTVTSILGSNSEIFAEQVTTQGVALLKHLQ